MEIKNHVRNGILGLVVGDALGVPVEFLNRETLDRRPVTGMLGYGTHHQPAGTWSDDSSLALCLADVLCEGYDLDRIGQRFVDWLYDNAWTPHGQVFDVGIGTRQAIARIRQGERPEFAGGMDERSNGNGSLMRILPLLFYIRSKSEPERFEIVRAVSSITHAHIRSVLACYYYLEFADAICAGQDKQLAYQIANLNLRQVFKDHAVPEAEAQVFNRILDGNLPRLGRHEIRGSGYVVHSLEASVWCMLTSGSYVEAVLKAVNLGEDTDTTGAIAGGLAGLAFGASSIPAEWIASIARLGEIELLIEQLSTKYREASS